MTDNETPINIKNKTEIINWIKSTITTMIIFILIGCGLGLYISKIIYNIKITEIVTVGGFVHNNVVYTVTIRP